ncbi:hypothetical protein PA25_21490 [Pseudoalteromonas sp. A25]|nr:hypothetical protein PA25_21490 [Pseudoalteromonas sp. A25]
MPTPAGIKNSAMYFKIGAQAGAIQLAFIMLLASRVNNISIATRGDGNGICHHKVINLALYKHIIRMPKAIINLTS